MPGPVGRKKNVTEGKSSVKRRGQGLGSGPVGHNQQGAGNLGGSHNVNGMNQTGGGDYGDRDVGSAISGGLGLLSLLKGKSPILIIVIVIALVFFGVKSGFLGNLLGGDATQTSTSSSPTQTISTLFNSGGSIQDILSSVMGSATTSSGSYSSGWNQTANTAKLDTSVASGTPAKRTVINGNGNDKVTIMIYMCGTDLESNGGAASADLQEMLASKLSDNVNVLIYTGGCRRWRNDVMSNKTNQIYRIFNDSGKTSMERLKDDCGDLSMTDPSTLSSFIKYCASNYKANREVLIFWDHGGGSITGYGHDEKHTSSGSMSLSGINQALRDGGEQFDFIGFDACLMASVENALMLSNYADYLIASEEVEPGCGWYYTNWLTKLSSNPSMSTLEIGKNIADDFVNYSLKECGGDTGYTLSVVDLAELGYTVPDKLESFAQVTSSLIGNGNGSESNYKQVVSARKGSREFGTRAAVDQVDLVDLANNMDVSEGKELSKVLCGAVKYNQTSPAMTNAYGMTIFFPLERTNYVKAAADIYDDIGLTKEYSDCIKKAAAMEVSGQAASGGTGNPLQSLLGSLGQSASSSQGSSAGQIASILGGLLGGGSSSSGGGVGSILDTISGLTGSNSGFLGDILTGKELSLDDASQYISKNQFNPLNLIWKEKDDGTPYISLSKDQWELVTDIKLAMFYDDGEGYIDLGQDNTFLYDNDNNLIGETDNTWLAIDRQAVCYYYDKTTVDGDAYCITGHIPCLVTLPESDEAKRADLILVFDNENEYGKIAGLRYVYAEGETETVAKAQDTIEEGTKFDFIADYYTYDGSYNDTYMIGETWEYTEDYEISNIELDSSTKAMYVFTDLYNKDYWTEVMP